MDGTAPRSFLPSHRKPVSFRWPVVSSLFGWIVAGFAATTLASPVPKVVSTVALEDLYIYPLKDAPATTVGLNDARVSAQIAGAITGIDVNVGDVVAAGDVIARLDCEEYLVSLDMAEAELAVAEAKLKLAQSKRDSANKLSKKKNIAKEELIRRRSDFFVAKAELDHAKAALANAARKVGHCQLRAPFSGVITKRIASTGDYAVTGTPVVRLLDNQNIEVAASVQEQDFTSLKKAEELTFFNGQHRFNLQVRTILPNMDSRLRSFEVRLSFKDKLAPPGAAGRLQWRTGTPYISSEYLVRRGADLGIFVFKEGIARFYTVAGAQKGRPARLTLPGNTQVILDGRQRLSDGDTVRVAASNTGRLARQ